MGHLMLGSEQVGTKKQPLSKLLFVLPLDMYNGNGMIIDETIVSSSGLM